MNDLTPEDRERLSKLAGLLASDFDGERSNAALLATRFLKQRGLTWEDVINPQQRQSWAPRAPHWSEVARGCLTRRDALTSWEFEFLSGLSRFSSLSPKQHDVLRRIAARVFAGCAQ